MKTSVSRSLCVALSGASVLAIAFTGAAYADRQGAPIRYAQAGEASQSIPVQSVPSDRSVTVNSDQRVEFRYPDQPQNFFSAQTPAAQTQAIDVAPTANAPSFDSPITFSPVDSVVSAAAPVATAAVSAVPKPDPTTVLAGGLSVAKTAVDLAKAPAQPIRIASLRPQAATSTGKPLTLSRVRANQDAKITEETGRASIYGDGFEGQPTANGEIFDETAMTAAHPSLPLPSLVQVTNQDNGREVVVRVNDRGPFDGQRIMELSPRAGSVLGVSKGSTANVKLRYLGPAPVKTLNNFASTKVEDDVLPPVTQVAAPIEPAIYEAPQYAQPVAPTVQAGAPTLGMGNVYIQAGAFADISNAQRLSSAVNRSLNVKIEEARVNGGDYFRVLIGPFVSMDDAEVQRAQLARAGIADGFLTRR